MDIRFDDHASFHRAAAGMTLGGALLGLCAHPITPMAPILGGLGGIAAGAAFGYGKPTWRLGAAAAAGVAILALPAGWPALAAAAGIMALAVSIGGLRGWRGLFAMALGAMTTLVAVWTAFRFSHAQQITWSRWAVDALSAGAMGMVGVLSMLPRHLSISIDPVQAAMRRMPAGVTGEMRGLCDRSAAIWKSAKDKLAANEPGLSLVREGVLKTIEVASASVDVDAAGDAELSKRITELDARIAAATDPEVRSQYQSARGALDDQRRYRDHIKQNRERLIARMHNHVAALEKFQIAASGLKAVRVATEGAPKQLDELSADVAASGEALAELELGETAVAAENSSVTGATAAATT